MKNCTVERKINKESDSNLVYHFGCSVGPCQRRMSNYIGLTTQTLRNRLGQHRYNGAINAHFTSEKDRLPKIDELIVNTKIIHSENIKSQLNIAETLYIELKKKTPSTYKRNLISCSLHAEVELTPRILLPIHRTATNQRTPRARRGPSRRHVHRRNACKEWARCRTVSEA